MTMTLTFDAISEASPGPKWATRWQRSWPAYEAWFIARGGDGGPSAPDCRDAMETHMPELIPTYDRLTEIAGGSDRAARFLSTWCPPAYLGGCSLAAVADAGDVRLVRNYDLSPELNEGLLLRSEWTGRAVMGMVEFLWGLSDGINDAGLCVALAFGGRSETGRGFGITTILRYVLETCETVAAALAVLRRVPSHMAYNIVLADAKGRTASVEMLPGGGCKLMPKAIATNHQSGPVPADRPAFTRSFERHDHLATATLIPSSLNDIFLKAPLIQNRYAEGFGTLFTAEYAPLRRSMGLTICGTRWDQVLEAFEEGQRTADYAAQAANATSDPASPQPATYAVAGVDWSLAAQIDWAAVAQDYAAGRGRMISDYLPKAKEAA
jgi:predicted choloylglycine hydrolase